MSHHYSVDFTSHAVHYGGVFEVVCCEDAGDFLGASHAEGGDQRGSFS